MYSNQKIPNRGRRRGRVFEMKLGMKLEHPGKLNFTNLDHQLITSYLSSSASLKTEKLKDRDKE